MCGIFGYIGDRNIASVLLVALERLSYRGYDSSGIAVLSKGELGSWKKSGKIAELSKLVDRLTIKGMAGIGHTRWATHGIANDINSHPHLSNSNKIALVHNGIIENYQSIKNTLMKKGYMFHSDTDTEVVVQLIQDNYTGSLVDALIKSMSQLEGSYALAILSEHDPETMLVAKKGSPLIIGIGQQENFVSSDINAILHHTKEIKELEDNQIALITQHAVRIVDTAKQEQQVDSVHINWSPAQSEKGGYDSFMMKEIHEQPDVIRKIMSKYIQSDLTLCFDGLSTLPLKDASRFLIQACGTSWHAGLIAKYWLEKYAKILTEVDISSEFRYRRMITHGKDLVLAISQSGETADTLAGIREAKSHFFPILSFVNVKNSSIDRESDAVVYSYSGQEVGVASTKNYVAQLTTLYLFTLHMATLRGELTAEQCAAKVQKLKQLPDHVATLLAQKEHIKDIASRYYTSDQFLFIGRGYNYPSALEGALKLKELSYIHATGYAAGELKHGPIALVDQYLPIICVAPKTSTYDKLLSNIQEVRSREGKTIIIANADDTTLPEHADELITIPTVSEELTPLLVSIPMQLLSYYIARFRDCDVDQPRNLAKSVTVE